MARYDNDVSPRTGEMLLMLERLEEDVAEFRLELSRANAKVESLTAELARETEECDEQARLVIRLRDLLREERDLADALHRAMLAVTSAEQGTDLRPLYDSAHSRYLRARM